jgi:hypothetical protein
MNSLMEFPCFGGVYLGKAGSCTSQDKGWFFVPLVMTTLIIGIIGDSQVAVSPGQSSAHAAYYGVHPVTRLW